MGRNKKVALVSVRGLPVPAVLGGAIETLETLIANENEKYGKLDLTIYSVGNEQSAECAREYEKTEFCYVNEVESFSGVRKIAAKILNHFGFDVVVNKKYYQKILEDCRRRDFDYIVFEEAEFSAVRRFARVFGREKIFLHLHSSHPYAPRLKDSLRGTIAVSKFVNDFWTRGREERGIVDGQENLIVTNAVNEDLFKKEVSTAELMEVRESMGANEGDVLVLYVGRVMEEKGVLELAQAVERIGSEGFVVRASDERAEYVGGGEVKLAIIGSANFADGAVDEYFEAVKEVADRSCGRIKMLGYVPNDELYKYCKAADIRCLPSKWEEAISLALIESLHVGTPLIVTRSGGMPDVVTEEGAVIVEKDGDLVGALTQAIVEVASSREKRELMRQANLERAKMFTKKKFYEDFVKVFK